MVRRNYKGNFYGCMQLFIIYREKGEEKAFEYANKVFGKSNNDCLRKKLKLYDHGGWGRDWLTDMFRDMDKLVEKHKNK